MSNVNTNIRAFNSKAKSLKFHNLYFMAPPQKVSETGQKNLLQARQKIQKEVEKVLQA